MVAVSRRIAFSVLNRLEESNAFPERLLQKAFEESPGLIQKDRALATELVYGVLRWRGRLDWVIGRLSRTPLHKIDLFVLNALRLGIYQILFLSRIPESAAVNESVELSKARAPSWVVRFVNGVMRAAARQAREMPLPGYDEDPVRALAVRESHPSWLVQRWIKRFGVDETRKLCQANNQVPPLTVRANTLKVSRQTLLSALTEHAREVVATAHAPHGISLRGLKHPISHIPCFKKGWFQVQDEASQLVTHLLDPKPGENVLDACAGFGGKTSHIAQLMKDQGKVRAMDNQSWKLEQLQAAMARLGISAVSSWHHDLSGAMPGELNRTFDRVLLDAPCSGLGVLRRNPDAKWKKKETDLTGLQARQRRFLETLAPLVKQGGCLVYAVCSLEPEEGEQVVQNFLAHEAEFVVDHRVNAQWHGDEALLDSAGFFRSCPHVHDTDGFFAVPLKRVAP